MVLQSFYFLSEYNGDYLTALLSVTLLLLLLLILYIQVQMGLSCICSISVISSPCDQRNLSKVQKTFSFNHFQSANKVDFACYCRSAIITFHYEHRKEQQLSLCAGHVNTAMSLIFDDKT